MTANNAVEACASRSLYAPDHGVCLRVAAPGASGSLRAQCARRYALSPNWQGEVEIYYEVESDTTYVGLPVTRLPGVGILIQVI